MYPTLQSREPPPQDGSVNSRTTSSIVYSCLITFCLSTILCLRPNIPYNYASRSSFLRKKLTIFMWYLLSPELIVCWAFYQWYEARKVSRMWKERGWTAVHGQFVIMGGLLLYTDRKPSQVLTPDRFAGLVSTGCIDFPSVTDKDIRLRGKSQPFLVGIVFLQSIWFTTQCVARLAHNLVITQLEMVTLAYLVLNAFLLALWWHKPLDAGCQIRIDLKRPFPPPPPHTDPDDEIVVARIKSDYARQKSAHAALSAVFHQDDSIPLPKKTFLRSVFSDHIYGSLEHIYYSYGELLVRSDADLVHEGDLEVSTFYSPDSSAIGPFMWTITNILGSSFAAAHLSMWFAYFPSHRDAMTWRICAALTAGLPLVQIGGICFAIGVYLIIQFFSDDIADRFLVPLPPIAFAVVILGLITLFTARPALLIEAFICLKSLPPSALQAVPWTDYIPHFS